jgi:hypothetical protein
MPTAIRAATANKMSLLREDFQLGGKGEAFMGSDKATLGLLNRCRSAILLTARATVLFGKENAQLLDSSKKGGFVDSEIPRRCHSVIVIALECGADCLHIENIVRGAKFYVRSSGGSVGRQFPGQMTDADNPVFAEDKGAFDGVFQFSDISRPIMGHEEGQGFGRDSLKGFLLQPVETGHELVHQEGNVLFSSA